MYLILMLRQTKGFQIKNSDVKKRKKDNYINESNINNNNNDNKNYSSL